MNNEDIRGLTWWAREKVRGFMTGNHKSPDFGFSLDFAQHRAYVPGDSPKYIDWSVVARQDKFLTKQFEAESNLRAYFVLDSSASMFTPKDSLKWTRAIQLITLSATLLQKQRDAIGLLELRDKSAHFFQAKSTHDSIEQLLFHINGKEEKKAENGMLAEELIKLLEIIPKKSQVILFTDVFHDNPVAIINALGLLKHFGHDVTVGILYSESFELIPGAYAGSLVKDKEAEAKTFIDVSLNQDLSTYVAAQLEFFKNELGKVGVKSLSLNTDDEVMVNFFKLLS